MILFSYFPLYVPYSHSCSLLTAICKKEGIEADYEPLWPGWFEKMIDHDFVGFSFITHDDYELAKPYMRAAKKLGKIVLVGGVYARMGAYIDPALYDHICRGEAETITDYLKTGDTSIFDNSCYQENIDGLPMNDLSRVVGNEFHRGYKFLQGLRIIPYQSSRGCGWGKCNFCMVQFQPKKIRIKHTIERDLTYLYETYKPDLIYMMEELPPYYMKEWRDQWENLYIPFKSYIRADIKPEHLEFMIEHGLKACGFGVETGSDSLRATLNKGVTNEDIWRTVGILKKNNIAYSPFFMGGIPGETAQDREDSVVMYNTIGGEPRVSKWSDLSRHICS